MFKRVVAYTCIGALCWGVCQASFADVDTQNLIAGYGTALTPQKDLTTPATGYSIGGFGRLAFVPFRVVRRLGFLC